MGKFLQGYSFVSLIIFATLVSRLYSRHRRFYDVCVSLFENDTYCLVFTNFLAAVSIFTIITVFNKVAGPLSNTELNRAKDEMYGLVFNVLISLCVTKGDVEGARLIFVIFAFLNRCVIFILRQKIVGMSLSPKLPTAFQHHNLIAMQLTLFFISFYFFMKCVGNVLREKDSLAVAVGLQFFKGAMDCALDTIRHVVFIFDRSNFGNSQKSFYTMMYTEYFIAIANLASDFLAFGCYIFVCHITLPIQLIHPIIETFKKLMNVMKKHNNWKRIMNALKTKLPDATAQDLQIEDTCIICRNQMDTTTGKKLPCGHCLHLECLERWVAEHDKCPMCQADLTHLIDDVNEEVHADANQQGGDFLHNIVNQFAGRIHGFGHQIRAPQQQQPVQQQLQPQQQWQQQPPQPQRPAFHPDHMPRNNARVQAHRINENAAQHANQNRFNFEDIDDENNEQQPQQFPIRGRRMNEQPQQQQQQQRQRRINLGLVPQPRMYGQNVQQAQPRQNPQVDGINNIYQQVLERRAEEEQERRRIEEEEARRYKQAHPQTPKLAPTVKGPKQATYNFDDLDSDSD